MSKEKSKAKTQVLRPIKKMVDKKAGPIETLKLEMLKDNGVGDYIRVFLGSPGGTPTEMILHHPIGVTDLDGDDWVFSSPDEIAQLKARSKDPNYPSLLAKRTEFIRKEAVKKNLLVIEDGSVFYHGHKDKKERSKFLDDVKTTIVKKHEKEKDFKFILDLALEEYGKNDPLVQAEQKYRKWVKPVQAEAERKFPQTYRTAKGPLSDTPQTAIKWLKTKKYAEVGPLFIKHGVTGPIASNENIEEDDLTIDPNSGAVNQWFFFDSSKKDVKKEIREALAKIRKDHGLDFRVLVKDA